MTAPTGPSAPPPGGLLAALRAAVRDPSSFSGRILRSGAWRMAGHGVGQFVRLAGNLVMTRLLAPEDFALMAVATAIQTGLIMATDVGINLNVVRSAAGEDPRFLRTAWTLRLLIHGAIAVALCLVGAALGFGAATVGFGDTIYADPRLPWVVAAISIALLLRGASSMTLALGERRMVMGRVMTIEIGTQVVTLAAMVGFAWLDPSVWALVGGSLVGALLRLVLSHRAVDGPSMGLALDRAHVVEMWSFGRWLLLSSFFGFINRQGDRLILGALLPPREFSIYVIARLWIEAGDTAVSTVSRPVVYGAISEAMRVRPGTIARVVTQARLIVGAACALGFAAFVILGETLIETLYLADYHPVGPMLVALAPIILLHAYEPFTALTLSAGRSRRFAEVTFINAMSMAVLMPAAFFLLGPAWAIFVVAIHPIWGTPRLLALAAELVPLKPWREAAIAAGLLAAAVLAAAPL